MTERQQMPRRYRRTARSGTPIVRVRHPETLPTEPPPLVAPPSEPTLFGLPTEPADDPPVEEAPPPADTNPVDAVDRLLVLPRPDPAAGTLLLIAGAAGGMSLFLPWVQHGGLLGLSLVQQGFDMAGSDLQHLVRSGLLLPFGVALGGGVLFLLGLLAFHAAPSHRAAGVVALFVSLAVATGLVVRVADSVWEVVRTDPGLLCALLIAGFGLLGALKAMLTVPEFTTEPR